MLDYFETVHNLMNQRMKIVNNARFGSVCKPVYNEEFYGFEIEWH
jgi:hypothetical protein